MAALNLAHFFDRTEQQIVGLFTLTYVPNYVDILSIYLIVLIMMPFIIALADVRIEFASAVSIAI